MSKESFEESAKVYELDIEVGIDVMNIKWNVIIFYLGFVGGDCIE